MKIEDLKRAIDEEELDSSLLDASSSKYGVINFTIGNPGEYHVVVNGERGPLLEYHKISEEEACNIVLNLLRDAPRKKVR